MLTLDTRSGWSKRKYKNEAKKELVKWLENINKQAKGLVVTFIIEKLYYKN